MNTLITVLYLYTDLTDSHSVNILLLSECYQTLNRDE